MRHRVVVHPFPICHNPYKGFPPSDPAIVAEAKRDARSLVTKVILPPGRSPRRTAPAGLGSSSTARNCMQSPDTVGFYDFWRTVESGQSMMTWMQNHPPAGSTLFQAGAYGQSGTIRDEWVVFSFPPAAGVSASRQLRVDWVPLRHGGSGVEVQSNVVWLLPRPAAEQVPGDVRSVTLTFTQYPISQGAETTQTVDVTASQQVQAIVWVTNLLPLLPPGPPAACAEQPPTVDATFKDANGNIIATADSAWCGDGVSFSIGGQPQYALGDGRDYYGFLNGAFNGGQAG